MLIDITGQVFGRLTAVKYEASSKKWLCECDCGRTKLVRADHLRQNRIGTCGRCRTNGEFARHFKHGLSQSAEYRCWHHLRIRCRSEIGYCDRGIKVCDRWGGKGGFINFLADMGRKPGKGYSIGRIDNNGDYSPTNCRWETATQQARNTRRSRFLTWEGVTQTVAGWSDQTGIQNDTILARLKLGWSVGRTLTTPVKIVAGVVT
jgi:hypothetical protein